MAPLPSQDLLFQCIFPPKLMGAHCCLLGFPSCQEQGVVTVLGSGKAVSLHWGLEKDVDSQASPLPPSYSLTAQICFSLDIIPHCTPE